MYEEKECIAPPPPKSRNNNLTFRSIHPLRFHHKRQQITGCVLICKGQKVINIRTKPKPKDIMDDLLQSQNII